MHCVFPELRPGTLPPVPGAPLLRALGLVTALAGRNQVACTSLTPCSPRTDVIESVSRLTAISTKAPPGTEDAFAKVAFCLPFRTEVDIIDVMITHPGGSGFSRLAPAPLRKTR